MKNIFTIIKQAKIKKKGIYMLYTILPLINLNPKEFKHTISYKEAYVSSFFINKINKLGYEVIENQFKHFITIIHKK